jgi:hypothetical protein
MAITTTATKTTYTIEPPDVSHLVTEDDTPVDNIYSEKQQRLLTEPLFANRCFGERPFVASANVGIYHAINRPAVVPDALVSLDVTYPPDIWEKMHRVYMTWVLGKPPEAVIEIVSNTVGNEAGKKFDVYARMGVPFYVIYDPARHLSLKPLRVYELRGGEYYEKENTFIDALGLGLGLWQGSYENMDLEWLRWQDASGQWVPTGKELAEAAREQAELERQRALLAGKRADKAYKKAAEEHQRAQKAAELAEQERLRAEQAEQATEQERLRAEQAEQATEQERLRAEQAEQTTEQERLRAEQERLRAERLAAKLRALGIEPE